MYGVDQLLTRKSMKPGLVFASASTDLGDDHQVIRIGVKRLLNDLIGYMGTVIVAGIDMIHAGCYRFSQNSNRTAHIARRSPHLRTGKLHCAIAHAVQAHRGTGECESAAQVHLFRHSVSPTVVT